VDFENCVAVVTGRTGALGGAVAMHLLANGARTVVTYRSEGEWAALEGRVPAHRTLDSATAKSSPNKQQRPNPNFTVKGKKRSHNHRCSRDTTAGVHAKRRVLQAASG
jgi:NAD(P)-dependent dehydrogenase (short-subunit alcohol dehydrogenase family)